MMLAVLAAALLAAAPAPARPARAPAPALPALPALDAASPTPASGDAAAAPALAPASSQGLGASPDLSASSPSLAGLAPPGPRLDGGLLRGRDLAGASAGLMAGDAVVLGLAVGTYLVFTHGAVSPTLGNYRLAGYTLLAATALLPPLGATLGGSLAGRGPRDGAWWKAFLLSFVAHSAALTVGYLAAPHYWAVIPVQVALMAPATSLGLNWGPGRRGLERGDGEAAPVQRPPPARTAGAAFSLGPTCPVGLTG